jgi:hypothetical protein
MGFPLPHAVSYYMVYHINLSSMLPINMPWIHVFFSIFTTIPAHRHRLDKENTPSYTVGDWRCACRMLIAMMDET